MNQVSPVFGACMHLSFSKSSFYPSLSTSPALVPRWPSPYPPPLPMKNLFRRQASPTLESLTQQMGFAKEEEEVQEASTDSSVHPPASGLVGSSPLSGSSGRYTSTDGSSEVEVGC